MTQIRTGPALAAAGIALALGLTSCGEGTGDEYASVCVSEETQTRVDDSHCRDSHPVYPFVFFFYPSRMYAPQVGAHITPGYVRTVPRRARVYTPPTTGGTKPPNAKTTRPAKPPEPAKPPKANDKPGRYNQPPKQNGGGYKPPPPRPPVRPR